MSRDRRPTFLAPFSVRGFRFLWVADLLTAAAIEMEVLILGWYMLVETGSVVLLTLLGAVQFTGTLVAPLFGVFGDRIGLRTLLATMRAAYALLATLLTLLAFTGNLSPVVVLVVAGIASLFRSSDTGMRAALVAHIVPVHQLMSAIAVARTTSDAARIAGALTGAGLFAWLGLAPAYLIVAACHLMGCLLTLGARPNPGATDVTAGAPSVQRGSHWRDLREGLAYVWRTPHLNAAVWLAFLANLTALPLSSGLLPYVAREVYRLDQNGLGALVACFGIGALIGSLTVSLGGTRIRAGRSMLGAAAAWYALLIVFAHVPTAAGGMIMLVFAGLAQSLCMVPLAAMMLRTTSVQFRGRVMGARMLAINSLPVGLLAAGPLIERMGFRSTMTLYAATGLVMVLAIAVGWRKSLLSIDAAANRR